MISSRKCVPVAATSEQLTNFYETYDERYAIGSHPKAILF